jgi:hypothetical protein
VEAQELEQIDAADLGVSRLWPHWQCAGEEVSKDQIERRIGGLREVEAVRNSNSRDAELDALS